MTTSTYASEDNPAATPVPGRGDDLLREAFRDRARHAVDHLARSASPEALARALASATDFGAVASALGHGAIPQAALDLDPFADALARGASAKTHLAEVSGGLLSAAETGRILGGISRQAVDKRRRGNQLLAVRVAADWRYPAMQVGSDGQPVPHLATILEAGAAAGLCGWTMLDFLLAPDDALGGETPLAAIGQGKDRIQDVKRLLEGATSSSFA